MNKKILLAVGMTFLLLAVSLPVTALTTSTETVEVQETAAIEKLMDAIENAAYNSQSMSEFLEKLNDLCESPDYNKLPLLRDLLHKILCYLMNHQGFYVGGIAGARYRQPRRAGMERREDSDVRGNSGFVQGEDWHLL